MFARKGWRSSTGVDRKVWQCSERYKVKGVMGCANRHVEEKTLIKAYLMAWNVLVENREDFMEQWTEQLQSKNLLEGYRAEKFIEYTDGAEPLTEMDTIICGIELIKLLFLSISRISFARNFSVWLGDINGIKYLSILPFPKNSSKALRNI